MSAIETKGHMVSADVSTDLSASQYRAVQISADRTITICGVGEKPIGILQDAPDGDEYPVGAVMVNGTSMAEYGDTVSAGDSLTTDATGRLVTATATTDFILANAWFDGLVGEIHSVEILHRGGTSVYL